MQSLIRISLILSAANSGQYTGLNICFWNIFLKKKKIFLKDFTYCRAASRNKWFIFLFEAPATSRETWYATAYLTLQHCPRIWNYFCSSENRDWRVDLPSFLLQSSRDLGDTMAPGNILWPPSDHLATAVLDPWQWCPLHRCVSGREMGAGGDVQKGVVLSAQGEF